MNSQLSLNDNQENVALCNTKPIGHRNLLSSPDKKRFSKSCKEAVIDMSDSDGETDGNQDMDPLRKHPKGSGQPEHIDSDTSVDEQAIANKKMSTPVYMDMTVKTIPLSNKSVHLQPAVPEQDKKGFPNSPDLNMSEPNEDLDTYCISKRNTGRSSTYVHSMDKAEYIYADASAMAHVPSTKGRSSNGYIGMTVKTISSSDKSAKDQLAVLEQDKKGFPKSSDLTNSEPNEDMDTYCILKRDMSQSSTHAQPIDNSEYIYADAAVNVRVPSKKEESADGCMYMNVKIMPTCETSC